MANTFASVAHEKPPLWPADSGRTHRSLLLGLCALSLAIQALIYTVVTNKPVIRSDGVGYQAYLPAFLVHQDPSFKTLEAREFPKGIPYWTGIHRRPQGYVIKYCLGVALLESPFFIAAHGVARAAGYTSVYSWPYQVAAAVSAAWYFGCGCLCVWILLRRRFEASIAFAALAATVAGTNLLHYATYDAAFSHVYSFFLISAFMVIAYDLYPASTRRWVAAGLLLGMIAVTRASNILIVVFPIAEWITESGTWKNTLRRTYDRWGRVGLAAMAAAAPVCLQLGYWKMITGRWFYYAYVNEGFNFFYPAGWRVLFSFEKGWFIYAPVVALATIGWFVARHKLYPKAGVVLFFTGLNLWVISSWHDWGYGGAFSMRPLVETCFLVALGVAGFLWRVWQRTWARHLSLATCAICAFYTLILMVGYWTHALPYIEATKTDIFNCLTFSWLKAS